MTLMQESLPVIQLFKEAGTPHAHGNGRHLPPARAYNNPLRLVIKIMRGFTRGRSCA